MGLDQRHQALRVGLSAILCALVFRLFSMGIPEKVVSWLTQPDTAAFLTYLETGRNVRFSPSLEAFSPDFVESPPASAPEPTQAPLPSFSDPESVEIYNASTKQPDMAALLAKPLTWQLRGEEPTVLILHTHTTESYTRRDEPYEEVSSWRTLDEGYNMLSIGDAVAEILEEAGIRVIRDRTVHDYPSYSGSYDHARESLQALLEEYPTVRMVLDLHRDAADAPSGGQYRTLASAEGQPCAQLMPVMGSGFEGFEENLSLALKLMAQLERQCPGITRPLVLRRASFNQDLCPGAVLMEVGAAGNSHAEALLAAKQLANAILALAGGTEEVENSE